MSSRLAVQNKVTKTGAFDGSNADSSMIVGDWTLILDVLALSGTARFAFEDSSDAFFSDIVAGPTVSITGGAGSGPRRFTFESRDFPNFRIGIGSAAIRLSLTRLTGTSASVTYQSWVDYGGSN